MNYPTYINTKTHQRTTPCSAGVNHLFSSDPEWEPEGDKPSAPASAETKKKPAVAKKTE